MRGFFFFFTDFLPRNTTTTRGEEQLQCVQLLQEQINVKKKTRCLRLNVRKNIVLAGNLLKISKYSCRNYINGLLQTVPLEYSKRTLNEG